MPVSVNERYQLQIGTIVVKQGHAISFYRCRLLIGILPEVHERFPASHGLGLGFRYDRQLAL